MPPTPLSPTWPHPVGVGALRQGLWIPPLLDYLASGPQLLEPQLCFAGAAPAAPLGLSLSSCSPSTISGLPAGPLPGTSSLFRHQGWSGVPSPFSALALTIEQCSQSQEACIWITEDEPSRQQRNEQPMNSDFIIFTQKMLWSSDLNLWQRPPHGPRRPF